jgi:hypothetical protein
VIIKEATLKAWMFALLAGTSFAVETPHPLSFVNDIQPILTKAGCNAGACHAKAITGQRGFRLSVLGFEPEEDYEAIVKQGKGRRVFPAAPEESLLITKGAAIVPHTGGRHLEPGSEEYKTLVRWIAEGMSYTQKNEATLSSILVEPARVTMKIKTEQQLKVTAKYSDGSSRDVTKLALFEANDRAMATAGEQGLVKTLDLPGNVAVMVRFGGRVSVCSVSIPLGAPVDSLPPVKNFIDQHVFANLKQIGVPPSPLCDDSTFLRRISLDIGGRLPTAEETKAFLASREPDKRDRAIEALLSSPDYADYFANKWTSLLKNTRADAADITSNFAFHAWMRDSLLANTKYDQIVRQILA